MGPRDRDSSAGGSYGTAALHMVHRTAEAAPLFSQAVPLQDGVLARLSRWVGCSPTHPPTYPHTHPYRCGGCESGASAGFVDLSFRKAARASRMLSDRSSVVAIVASGVRGTLGPPVRARWRRAG